MHYFHLVSGGYFVKYHTQSLNQADSGTHILGAYKIQIKWKLSLVVNMSWVLMTMKINLKTGMKIRSHFRKLLLEIVPFFGLF